MLATELGDPHLLARGEQQLGAILLRFGRPALARESLERAQGLYRELGQTADVLKMSLQLARSLRAEGRSADALRCLTEGVQEAPEQGFESLVAQLLSGRASLTEDPGEIRGLAAEATQLAPEDPWLRLNLLAMGALPDADLRALLGALPDTLSAFQELERDHLVWKITGDVDALAEAKHRLEMLTLTAPAKYRSSMRDGIPTYREITGA